MNLIETLTSGIQFEEKTSLIYQRVLSFQNSHPDSQTIWKEIVSQKEKQIQLIKNALQGMLNQGPNSSRIHLISSRDMEEGLAWIHRAHKEFHETEPVATKIIELIYPIVSFELQSIYSPLLKVFDLQFIKGETLLISLLTKHLQTLNNYLKKQQASSLTPLMKNYPFLVKKEDKKRGFSEDELFQNLLNQKKSITLRLKNGKFFSGKLSSFDHFSLKCLQSDSGSDPVTTLFPKESILSVQIHD